MTIFDFLFGIACLVGAIVMIVLVNRRWPVSAAKAADWPEVEGTIQSVNQVMVGRASNVLDVADFSYAVGNEFNSGRVTVSRGFSTAGNSTKELVNQKVRVLYNPEKPEVFSFPAQEVAGFQLAPFVGINATDVNPIDLNIA